MESLRERAIAAYQKEKELLPYYRSVQVENWVAEEFGVECDPVIWEKEWEGEVDLGELSLWVHATEGFSTAWLMWRCSKCGKVERGDAVHDLVGLGKALLREQEFCPACGRSYARD